jgi:hypothetical protein
LLPRDHSEYEEQTRMQRFRAVAITFEKKEISNYLLARAEEFKGYSIHFCGEFKLLTNVIYRYTRTLSTIKKGGLNAVLW